MQRMRRSETRKHPDRAWGSHSDPFKVACLITVQALQPSRDSILVSNQNDADRVKLKQGRRPALSAGPAHVSLAL